MYFLNAHIQDILFDEFGYMYITMRPSQQIKISVSSLSIVLNTLLTKGSILHDLYIHLMWKKCF